MKIILPLILCIFSIIWCANTSTWSWETWVSETQIYENKVFDFTITLPKDAILNEESNEYTRFQNYTINEESDYRWGLAEWEYYVEIFINQDNSWNKYCEIWDDVDFIQTYFWSVAGLYGNGWGWWDPGWIRRAVCIINNWNEFYFQATENNEWTPIANSILESISFK